MNQEAINLFSEQTKKFYAPFTQFNSIMANSLEKITELQLSAVKTYAELGLDQLRSLSKIEDANSLNAFGQKQAELMSNISSQVVEDSKKMAELGNDFKAAIDELFKQSLNTMNPADQAATASKPRKSA